MWDLDYFAVQAIPLVDLDFFVVPEDCLLVGGSLQTVHLLAAQCLQTLYSLAVSGNCLPIGSSVLRTVHSLTVPFYGLSTHLPFRSRDYLIIGSFVLRTVYSLAVPGNCLLIGSPWELSTHCQIDVRVSPSRPRCRCLRRGLRTVGPPSRPC